MARPFWFSSVEAKFDTLLASDLLMEIETKLLQDE
jgi:hypothetical protein